MKTCARCGEEKSLDNYYYHKRGTYHPKCKKCSYILQKERVNKNKESVSSYQKSYREKNKDRLAIYIREYQQKNKEKLKKIREASKDWLQEYNKAYHLSNRSEIRARQKAYKDANKHLSIEYRLKNKDALRSARKKWESENRHLINAKAAKRRFSLRQAVPIWVDLEKIAEIYADAQKCNGMHVDHIIPLQSDIVCGLHVHHNLQILPASMNQSKGNRIWPDMP